MDNRILVSIIIRTFNEEAHIQKLLKNIFNQVVNFEFEVIVVDSGSTDSTLEKASQFTIKIVKILPEKFSFGYSLNKGIELAKGDYCVFISAHCYPVGEKWLEEIVKPFDQDKVALVYGKQRGSDETHFSESQIFKKWFPKESVIQRKNPFCNNANSAIKKVLWEAVKYDDILTGLEDLDWAKKNIKMGYCVYYNSNACVIHVHDQSYRQVYYRYKREAIAFLQIYPKERFGFFTFLKLFIMNVSFDYRNSIKSKCFFKNIYAIPFFRIHQFWGTYKGFHYSKKINKKIRNRFYYP